MLGVVGIHTGSELLSNPQANMHLFAVLEIVSRFSVPIFFFVSAFSLFRQYPLDGPFDAGRFYRRRFARVLLPYLVGSVLYMLHYSWLTADWSIWLPILVYQFFGFGTWNQHAFIYPKRHLLKPGFFQYILNGSVRQELFFVVRQLHQLCRCQVGGCRSFLGLWRDAGQFFQAHGGHQKSFPLAIQYRQAVSQLFGNQA